MNIIFFGSSGYVIPIIEVLRKNFDLKLVLTTERLALPGQALQPPVIKYCLENKIPYFSVSSLSDQKVKSQLLNVNCQIAILANFGLIIPQEILNAFPKGIINIHPSLLPKFRGPTPVQTAILNGDKETGVSIMRLDNEIDHGPILSQIEEKISPTDTSESLYKRLFKLGADSIIQTIELYLKGNIKPQAQNHKEATFTKHLTRADGYVDLKSLEIRNLKLEIARRIRAYYPWPGVWFKTKINGVEKIIKLLPENKIQVEGKKPMSYKDFINGYPEIDKKIFSYLCKLDDNE